MAWPSPCYFLQAIAIVHALPMNLLRKEGQVSEADYRRLRHQIEEEAACTSVHLEEIVKGESTPVTKEFFKAFRICGRCSKFERLGESNDGGYVTCMDSAETGSIKAAYSMGVSDHDRFAKDATKLFDVNMYQFDCTVAQAPDLCDKCSFSQECIVADPEAAYTKTLGNGHAITLEAALAETGMANAPSNSLLLKIDIEGSEWDILRQLNRTTLSKFHQLIVEFHHTENVNNHPEYLDTMRNLHEAGFQVVHIHGNNCKCANAGKTPMYVEGELSIPMLLEVTLVYNAESRGACLEDQEFLPEDRKNVADDELPAAHLVAKS